MVLRRAAATDGAGAARAALLLPFEIRSRSRFRARLDDGTEVGVMLPRGQILRGGDRLLAENGLIVEILAAREAVSTAHARDAGLLARGAYHLGNRHVPLEIGALWLRYGRDHVLDAMLAGMGFELSADEEPFEPEAGAYHGHANDAGHGHEPGGHAHGHGHGSSPGP